MGWADLFDENGDRTQRRTCPRKEITAKSHWLLGLHQQCQNLHVLPFPGALVDQPAFLVDAFAVIDERLGFWDIKRQEENKRKTKRK